MDKFAFYRQAGRDLAARAATDVAADELSKTASAGGPVDPVVVENVEEILHANDYVDELNKIAYHRGESEAFAKVAQAIRSGEYTADELVDFLEETVEAKTASAMGPLPESDSEFADCRDTMIIGAAQGLGAMYGVDPSEDVVIEKAAQLVSYELDGE